MKYYVEKIKKFQPFDLYAYPSTAYLLANFCNRNNVDLRFSCVFTSSEMLFDHQKEEIKKAFRCRIFDWYGSAERVSAIAHCENENYHEIPSYSIVEYLPIGGEKYEIVGTGLHNFAMPLIRYALKDIVEIADESSPCSCGRPFKRIKTIHGRTTNLIITPDQRKISIVNHIPWGMRNIIEIQFIQKKLDEIDVLVVGTSLFSEKDIAQLKKRLKDYISPDIKYRIQKVDKIERTPMGKFNAIIQETK